LLYGTFVGIVPSLRKVKRSPGRVVFLTFFPPFLTLKRLGLAVKVREGFEIEIGLPYQKFSFNYSHYIASSLLNSRLYRHFEIQMFTQ
jgi:hypothetical protein